LIQCAKPHLEGWLRSDLFHWQGDVNRALPSATSGL
jgi:hypothetical protein